MFTGINHLKTQPIQALKTNNPKHRGTGNTASQRTNGVWSSVMGRGLAAQTSSQHPHGALPQHIAPVSSRHKFLCRQNCKDKRREHEWKAPSPRTRHRGILN